MDGGISVPVVLDFHPLRLRASRERQEKRELHTWVVEEPTTIVHPAFERPINSWLPFVSRVVPGMESYDGLLIDEERLIGLKVRVALCFCVLWNHGLTLDFI